MQKKFGKILFFGIGGGNDIFSTTLAMASLWNIGWRWEECAVAGVLSPFHSYTLCETKIPDVDIIDPGSSRFLDRRFDGEKKIAFVDAAMSNLVKDLHPYNANKVFGFWLRKGSESIAKGLNGLAEEYEFTVLVDIGGDCFYHGPEDKHVLSPMFDSLALAGFNSSKMKGVLFEAGPGTDGELEPDSLLEALKENNAASYPLAENTINWWETIYNKYIKKVRPGRTVPMTIAGYRSYDGIMKKKYRARAQMGNQRFYKYFYQKILTNLCKNFYLVTDPLTIKNPFTICSNNVIQWFIAAQSYQFRTNCEANLQYIWLESGKLVQFLTPSPLFKEETQMEIINIGLRELSTGVYDQALMFESDWIEVPKKIRKKFRILGETHNVSNHLIYVAPKR